MSAFAIFICPITSEFLLVQQRGEKWSLPGGHREKGEAAKVAIRRECVEEISFDPGHLEPTSIVHIERTWCDTPAVAHVFFCRPKVKRQNEITAYRWCDHDSLPRGVSKTAAAMLKGLCAVSERGYSR